MEKAKRKGKSNRRRVLIIIGLVLLSGCLYLGFSIYSGITNPRFEAPIFADIDVFSTDLVETRLLEYIAIGESTCEDVKAFGDEYLAFEFYDSSCDFPETPNQIYYNVDRRMFACNWYYLQIIFVFEDNVLSDIKYENFPSCL